MVKIDSVRKRKISDLYTGDFEEYIVPGGVTVASSPDFTGISYGGPFSYGGGLEHRRVNYVHITLEDIILAWWGKEALFHRPEYIDKNGHVRPEYKETTPTHECPKDMTRDFILDVERENTYFPFQ